MRSLPTGRNLTNDGQNSHLLHREQLDHLCSLERSPTFDPTFSQVCLDTVNIVCFIGVATWRPSEELHLKPRLTSTFGPQRLRLNTNHEIK